MLLLRQHKFTLTESAHLYAIPFDDAHVQAGQGTVAMKFLKKP